MSDIQRFDKFILNENIDGEYYVEYCTATSGHGELSERGDFSAMYSLAKRTYKEWASTSDIEYPNDKTTYMGVSIRGGGGKFAIIFISQSYYDNMHVSDFDTGQNYNIWLNIANECLHTSRPKIGKFIDDEQVKDDQLSLFEENTDFTKKREDNFNKEDSYEPMSDDILAMAKNDKGEFEKIKGKVDIVQITGIVPEEDVKEIEKALKENITLDTSLTITDVKRGQELWLVALLRKSNSTAWNAQQLGVIKVRVVDYFYGLNKLHSLKKDGRI